MLAASAMVATCFSTLLAFPSITRAADHAEAPLVANDRAADIGDIYFFVDPNDNKNVILAMDVVGFVASSENANMGLFDPTVRFRFLIDNTGRAEGDAEIFVQFAPQTSRALPQTATITLPDGSQFTAQTTTASVALGDPPKRVITFDPKSEVYFFAGLTDDPFFFDIPAEQAFVKSVLAGKPDATTLQRGRDSFAGYNTCMVTLEVPVSMIRGSKKNHIVGLSGYTQRRETEVFPGKNSTDGISGSGTWVTVVRMGNPAVATVLLPTLAMKDQYNHSTLQDDVKGKYASSIVATLKSLGTDSTSIGILAGVAVTNGDQLHLDLDIPNTGKGGGDNPAAAFPNGRRPKDDVIDTLLTLIANRSPLGDNVNANDVPFRDKFPFFGYAHQPLPHGTIDDFTRN